MRFAPKHVVTMVACVSGAVVLAPISVRAATGSLVNIADAAYANRLARVSSDGSLRVESHSGTYDNMFIRTSGDLGFAGASAALLDVAYPKRIAITELSLSSDTYINANNSQYSARVEIYQLTRTSGTNACAMSASGWTSRLLRYVSVASGSTVEFNFSGAPIQLTPPSDQRVCLVAFVRVMPSNGHVFAGATGYVFTP